MALAAALCVSLCRNHPFVDGNKRIAFMGLATLIMALEKLPDLGRLVTRPLGVVLCGWAGAICTASCAVKR